MPEKQELTPQIFTEAVDPFVQFLTKKFPGKSLCVSDVRDRFNRQYVDLIQEGGGVHGIALAGYTYVLEKMGIAFMKMAGTSAGSINTLLLNAVYTDEEAKFLNKPGTYYETRSEKVLEYLAKKNLTDLVDGHPLWRKLLLGLFNQKSGSSGFKLFFIKAKNWLIAGAVAFIFLIIAGLGLAFYNELNNFRTVLQWVAGLSALLTILVIGLIAGRLLFARLLYRNGEKFGINPGKDFEDWVKKLLLENGIKTVTDLKNKLAEEADKLGYGYKSCDALAPGVIELQTVFIDKPGYQKRAGFAEVVEAIKDPTVKVDVLYDKLADVLYENEKQFEVEEQKLAHVMNAFEERLENDKRKITKEIVLVTSDITHELKVEFPGMHSMYWGDDYSISPALYVRASMSVPLFFKPMQVDFNPAQKRAIDDAWEHYIKARKSLQDCALFVDGGMLSNFPLNVFYNPELPVPRKPTFGIKLEYEEDYQSKQIQSLIGLAGSLISTMRFFYDRDFILKHDMYKKTVRSIDTGKIHWLNFDLKDKEKIELFFRGALTATIFLSRHAITEDEVQQLMNYGMHVKTNTDELSIYEDEKVEFKTEDNLMQNVTFEWQKYKMERLLDRVQRNDQKLTLKTDAALGTGTKQP